MAKQWQTEHDHKLEAKPSSCRPSLQIFIDTVNFNIPLEQWPQGGQIWAQSGPDWLHMEQIRDFSPKCTELWSEKVKQFVPSRANLTTFGPNLTFPFNQANQVFFWVLSANILNWILVISHQVFKKAVT